MKPIYEPKARAKEYGDLAIPTYTQDVTTDVHTALLKKWQTDGEKTSQM